MSTPPPAWMDQALCAQLVTDAGMDPEAWTGDPNHPDRPLALAACDRCPVAADCAQAGRREEWGIWGGVAAFTTGALLNGPTLAAVVLCLATLRAMWGAARTTTRSNP